MVRLGQEARRVMPADGIQIPPNLADWWPQLVEAGATDLGGLSANGDHISPEHPFPSPLQVRKRLDGLAAPTERLCVYPQYISDEWLSPRVLDVVNRHFSTFVPRRGRSGVTADTIARARDGGRLGAAERAGAGGDVRRGPPRGHRGHAPGGRLSARGAGGGDGDVRGQPQHQRLQHLHGRLRVLRLRRGPPVARRLRVLAG